MSSSLYLAWRYLAFHKGKTALVAASVALVVYLPLGLEVLVSGGARELRARASATALVVGAPGSPLELVLSALYFESDPPHDVPFRETERVNASGLAEAIPLYVRFRARGRPIVGTTLDYFRFRGLRIRTGRQMATLGECVLGSAAAERLGLAPGDVLVSSPESAFDLAGAYPLAMRVAGVFAATDSPDDGAVFVDLKTAWVVAGLGHGHQDLAADGAEDLLLEKQGGRLTANAAVVQYTEITPENADSFHFHGDRSEFPLTAVIAVPQDAKAAALLTGRYLSADERAQIVRPLPVVEELLATVFKVRTFVIAGAVLVGLCTATVLGLVLALSLRLRRREMMTMARIGGSRFQIARIVSLEVVLVLVLGGLVAATLTAVTSRFGAEAVRWLLL